MNRRIPLTLFAPFAVLTACADHPTSPAPGSPTSGSSPPVSAAATRTVFEGFIHPCGGALTEERVTPGDVLHQLATNQNEWVTGDPLIDGVENNVVRININLKTGRGIANVTSTIAPEGVEGTWELKYQVKVIDGGPATARGVGHGTGELRGMTLKFTADLAQPGQNNCNAEIPVVVPIRGIIQ
jgi:hypothetical protein